MDTACTIFVIQRVAYWGSFFLFFGALFALFNPHPQGSLYRATPGNFCPNVLERKSGHHPAPPSHRQHEKRERSNEKKEKVNQRPAFAKHQNSIEKLTCASHDPSRARYLPPVHDLYAQRSTPNTGTQRGAASFYACQRGKSEGYDRSATAVSFYYDPFSIRLRMQFGAARFCWSLLLAFGARVLSCTQLFLATSDRKGGKRVFYHLRQSAIEGFDIIRAAPAIATAQRDAPGMLQVRVRSTICQTPDVT